MNHKMLNHSVFLMTMSEAKHGASVHVIILSIHAWMAYKTFPTW